MIAVAYDPANPTEYAAHVIMGAARSDFWPWDPTEQQKLLRHARRITHPDVNGGDRAGWDLVDWAATVLNLREKRASA